MASEGAATREDDDSLESTMRFPDDEQSLDEETEWERKMQGVKRFPFE